MLCYFEEWLEFSMVEIGLIVWMMNCLEEKGIFMVCDLLNIMLDILFSILNFGEKMFDEVYKVFDMIGFFCKCYVFWVVK